jgi:hypothetical protein
MNDIDEKILAAMNAEERHMMEPYASPPGIFGMMADSFRGSLGWVVAMVFVFILVFFGLLVYSAIRFFPETDLESKLDWFAIGLTSLIAMALLRLWYFMELVRLSIIRELKRLELQVSLLSKKLQ